MPKLLITAQEVITLAIPNTNMRTEWIKNSVIETAQESHILPVLGAESDGSGLYDKLINTSTLEGDYKTLNDDYVKPALAFFIKAMITPDIFTQITNTGLMANSTENSQTVSAKDKEVFMDRAKQTGEALIDKMVRYLNLDANAEKFPEWSNADNIQEKVTYKGGIITRRQKRNKGTIYW